MPDLLGSATNVEANTCASGSKVTSNALRGPSSGILGLLCVLSHLTSLNDDEVTFAVKYAGDPGTMV